MSSPNLPYDVAIVGLGISSVHQLTREAEETIRRCDRVFVADHAPGAVDYLKGLNSRTMDLTARFSAEAHRLTTYRNISAEIVAAALEKSPVCFATYGHPKMYSYPTILIERAASILDLKIMLLPGISFLDTLLIDLDLDPGFDGLQLYEATDLLVRDRPLQPDVACVIAQAPVVLEPRLKGGMPGRSNLEKLQAHLLKFYPPNHEFVIVISKTHPLASSVLQRARLGELAKVLAKASHSGTLYIPPIHRREIADQELADKMRKEPSAS
jgi:uncharacterized protein YabN with tetrapyrrole methylase and pyrophosphatase domain